MRWGKHYFRTWWGVRATRYSALSWKGTYGSYHRDSSIPFHSRCLILTPFVPFRSPTHRVPFTSISQQLREIPTNARTQESIHPDYSSPLLLPPPLLLASLVVNGSVLGCLILIFTEYRYSMKILSLSLSLQDVSNVFQSQL